MVLTRTQPRRTALLTVVALVASLLVATAVATPPAAQAGAIATERAPDIVWGGRTVAVSINPENPDHVLAASESGGIYVTLNGGASWDHVDGMPQHRMVDLRFHPSNGDIVLATAVPDSQVGTGGGGIWRSADGGVTWTQPAGANVCARFGANGIAWERGGDGTVAVATDCGVAISTDSGGTWTQSTPGGGFESSITADYADDGTTLVMSVCGQNGFQRSTDGGTTWTAAVNQPAAPECSGAVWAHSLQTSPYDEDIIWAAFWETDAARTVFTGTALWESRDGGATWGVTKFETNRNRPPFVRVHESNSGDPTEVDVFYGNGVRTFLETCNGDVTGDVSTTGSVTCDGTGPQVAEDHADQFDIAWPAGSNCATFMSSDGGVHSSGDCGASWSMTGGSGDGFGALQIYDLALQAHPDHTDLYFGTQDNLLWASPDGGASWPTSVSAEGFFLDVPATGDGTHDNSIVTGVRCAACSNFKTAEHFTGVTSWNDPVAAGGGNPYLLKEGWYAHIADSNDPTDNDPTLSVYVNDNVDAPGSWVKKVDFVDASSNPYALRGRAIFAGPPGDPVMYQGYQDSSGNTQLLKVTGLLTSASPTITELAPLGNVGGYCNGQGTFVCPTVFGVNPANADHIIAVDTGAARRAVQSTDGGASWTPDPGLTAAVTVNGTYRFANPNGGGSQVHVIKFDPANPDRILIGTEQAGIVASYDGGTTWGRVTGSEEVPAISDVEFDQVTGDIWVSSYGRGLWTIELPEVDLSITKAHRPESPVAGQEVLYDLTVRNDGPDMATDVLVTDVLPEQVTYVTTTLGTNGDGCAVTDPGDATTGETVTCTIQSLTAGEQVTFTIRGYVADDAVSENGGPVTVTNQATVGTVSATDTDPSNDTTTDSAIIVDMADLEIAKVCDEEVLAGETATCTITIDNEGPSDARGVIATDVLSSDTGTFTIESASSPDGTCSVSGGDTVECDLGTIEASTTTATGRATVLVQVSANEGQTIEDLATVRSDTPDPDDTNDQAIDAISVTALADLELGAVTASAASVVAGGSVGWTFPVTNGGPSTAANVVVEIAVPSGVAVTSATTTDGGACTLGTPGDPSDPIVCGMDDMPPGDTDSVTVQVDVDPAKLSDLTVSAAVSSDTLDLDDSDDLASIVTPVTTSSDVRVSAFVATPDPVVAGTPITYAATVVADGPSVARDVEVVIALPAEVDFATASVIAPATGSCAPTTEAADSITCALGALAPGEAVTISVEGDVAAAADPGVIEASATASSTTPDPAAGNNVAVASTTVQTSADAYLDMSGPAIYDPSSTVRLTVEVHNAGPSDSRGGEVEITLPTGRKTGEFRGTDGPCTESGGTVTCTIPTLAPGEQVVFTFDYFIRGNKKRILFDGILTTQTPDPNAGNDSALVEMDTK